MKCYVESKVILLLVMAHSDYDYGVQFQFLLSSIEFLFSNSCEATAATTAAEIFQKCLVLIYSEILSKSNDLSPPRPDPSSDNTIWNL